MHKIKVTTLKKFIKDECANYGKFYQKCLCADSCRIFDGQRCTYFEKCVLGPPDYKYKLPGYDYSKLFAQYAELTKTEKQRVKVRYCNCGTPLQHRQRCCEICSKRREKEANRQRQRKHRLSNSLNVTV